MKNTPSFLRRGAAVFTLTCLAGSLNADTFSWTGGGGDNNWNNADNWTLLEGESGRLFPNDPNDIAIINQTLSADAVINVPTGTFDFRQIQIGDAGGTFKYTLSGLGTLRDNHNETTSEAGAISNNFTVLNGATVDFAGNIHVQRTSHEGRRSIAGDGNLLFTGNLTGSQFVTVVSPTTLTVRVDEGSGFNPNTLRVAGRVEVNTQNFTTAKVEMHNNGKLVTIGQDRSFNGNFELAGVTDTGAFFDGTSGYNLTVNGTTTFVAQGTNVAPARLRIDTSTLTLAGGLVINSGQNMARHPIRLVNQGTLELTGTSTSSQDLYIDGIGTMLINNTTGSALGSGDLRLGRGSGAWVPTTTSVTLSGTGSMDGTIYVSGYSNGSTLAPGTNDAGTLTAGGVVFFESGLSTPELLFNFREDGSHGHLSVLGDLTFTGLTNFTLLGLENLMGATVLATYGGSLIGQEHIWENFVLPEGYSMSYSGGEISIVPEPGTYALFAGVLGLTLVLARRRRVVVS